MTAELRARCSYAPSVNQLASGKQRQPRLRQISGGSWKCIRVLRAKHADKQPENCRSMRPEFVHAPRPVHLHGARGNAQLGTRRDVGVPGCNQVEHLDLAPRETMGPMQGLE